MKTFKPYQQFTSLISRHPLLGSIVITTSGFFTGDYICQWIESRYRDKKKLIWNRQRSFNFTFIGFAMGPQFHYLVPFVARVIPGTGVITALKRAVFGQFILGPYGNSFVLSLDTILYGGDIEAIKQRLRNDFLTMWAFGCLVWVPGNFVCYWIIPPQFRVLFLNALGINWRVFMSYLVNKKSDIETHSLEM
eukprot:211266_1